MQTLIHRTLAPERMDDPVLDAGEHHRALRGLARINWWTRSAAILWPIVAALARQNDGPLRVLDIASGAGDVPIALTKRAKREGLGLQVEGCDVSPTAVAHAVGRARQADADVRFFRHDVIRDPLPMGHDLVTSSLFIHHLTEDVAVTVLGRMKQAARRALAVSDLRRSRAGYWLAWAGTRLLSRSPVVRFDGPVSVQAAFTLAEARLLADRAGLIGASVEPRWPFRFLLTWSRP